MDKIIDLAEKLAKKSTGIIWFAAIFGNYNQWSLTSGLITVFVIVCTAYMAAAIPV
jgi:hypothetical protein